MKLRTVILLLACACYLGIHNGYLTIFENNEPKNILPYRAELFPDLDLQALRKGIPFRSKEELTALLEDFLS